VDNSDLRRIRSLVRHIEFPADLTKDCWLWKGSKNAAGYAMAISPPHNYPRVGHRVLYKLLVGPVPDVLVLDHLCRVRACVNPFHLDLVTRGENARRARGPELPDAGEKVLANVGRSWERVLELLDLSTDNASFTPRLGRSEPLSTVSTLPTFYERSLKGLEEPEEPDLLIEKLYLERYGEII
jgi:hypothetical protein